MSVLYLTSILDCLRASSSKGSRSQDALAELKTLANIIQSSVEQIEAVVTANSFTFPSPESPFSFESEAPRMHPDIQSAGLLITSAAAQLMTLVRPAPIVVWDLQTQVKSKFLRPWSIAHDVGMTKFHVCSAMRVAISTHVAEILRGTGPQGRHVREIAKPTNAHPGKMARILRLLATNHIFIEVTPDVFANNRLSSVLDTGKSVEELLASPESKHVGTHGMASLIEHALDEGFKSSSYLTETLLDPEFGHASEANKSAFSKAFNVEVGLWSWLERPDNRLRLARFGAAMNGLKNVTPRDTIIGGYAWEKLPEGSLVVDVGGGVGAQSLTLATHFPHLCFVVRDRESVIADAVEFWKTNMPDALESGRVKLQGHNFFEPQPVQQQDISVFVLRNILHNWADEYCLTILKHLRAAAGPKTQLIVVDRLITCACDEPVALEIPGAERLVPPRPLLPNFGRAASMSYNSDLMMMTYFNSQERTITHLRDLLDQAGWKLSAVHDDSPTAIRFRKTVAVPN